ncbi:FAD-dependent monooxygenase [Streptodolium elevatio]|uniref:FAD-dependent monooxygenase n=1 Tax=Streptodolium elevatio TaxID=3157996 RepID=A0ABV3DJN7_9ACTN
MTRIAVVGGGIAGLTLAVAAHRAGLAVSVHEQAAEPSEGEAGLQLSPNAVRLLDRLGVGPALRDTACRPASMEFLRWRDGDVLLRVPVRPGYAERFGADHHTLRRADLRRMLAALLPAGVLRTGSRCTGVEEFEDRVRASFADGSSVDADVLVGADGLRSVLREHTNPGCTPRHSGMDAYRGVAVRGPADRGSETAVRLWIGRDRHFLCYPMDAGRLLNVVAVLPGTTTPSAVAGDHAVDSGGGVDADDRVDGVGEAGRPGRSGASGGPGRVPSVDLADAFAGWDPEVAATVLACPGFHRWPLYDLDPLATWSTGRTTLIGDAAHPMLPHQAQGACQAIEDAVALATLLGHAGRIGVPEALRRFHSLRGPRTARVQAQSRDYASLMHSPQGAELAASLAPEDLIARLAETYGHDAEAQAQAAALA